MHTHTYANAHACTHTHTRMQYFKMRFFFVNFQLKRDFQNNQLIELTNQPTKEKEKKEEEKILYMCESIGHHRSLVIMPKNGRGYIG